MGAGKGKIRRARTVSSSVEKTPVIVKLRREHFDALIGAIEDRITNPTSREKILMRMERCIDDSPRGDTSNLVSIPRDLAIEAQGILSYSVDTPESWDIPFPMEAYNILERKIYGY